MAEEDILRGARRAEFKVFLRLYPVFRRYLRDRDEAKKEEESTWSYRRERNGSRAVEAFISLGPTFVKLGQVLSARPDLLPREYIKSFEKLQDEVPPAPFEEVEPILRKNISNFDTAFEEFDRNAISGASLGQVYHARYKGKEVAVKVNRPNIEFTLRRDLYVINRLLRLARGRIENFLYISVMNVINDFNSRIYDEIDYRKESSNAERIRKNIRGRERVIIPEIIQELSSKEVLTLEFRPGIKITDLQRLREAGIDLKNLAWRIDLLFMRMLLRDDIFHADPHPGNISVTPDGEIILFDFGMVGTLDSKTRFSLLALYDGLVNTDPDAIMDALITLGALSPAANRAIMRKSMELAIANFYGKSPDESEVRELFEIANNVIFEFPFRLPRSLVLYMRMSSLLEGICLQLDPEFRFVKILRELLYREGLLDELYRRQLQDFVRKAVVSIEKGIDALPLLKRRLEDADNRPIEKKDRKVPASIFLGSVLIASVILLPTRPLESYIAMLADLVGFSIVLIKK
ncbi:MAG: AarF/ABC1/UbiB kinase family protein [Candidatus Thermoplasmatota archaeon]|nr:AarF/ABC1/UbiB kinase family protein [Candidatus Thermoplasmatota archaeon]